MATSSAQSIVIGGLITPIARSRGIELNPDGRVPDFEWLNLAAFKQVKFCKVEAGCLCWIYLGSYLISLPNIERATLLNRANLHYLAGNEELAQPAPPTPQPYLRASSSS